MNDFQQFAEVFALKSGALMKKNFALGMTKEWKNDNTPVTATDLEINR
jgi:3'-phosphoadenosine 5'-phosphosulfate (PAPS) 3'-phosphatase